jgi:hypothetical protein
MVSKFFLDRRPHNGLTYKEYFKQFQTKVDTFDPSSLNEDEKKLFEYTKLNFQRSSRINKTYNVSSNLCETMKKISKNQLWMVITEDWCGDSAQNLPYIAKISECNLKIDLRILLRDHNLDIMDLYLTNNKLRSIPKLVAFDEVGNELFQWGSRPKEAQDLVTRLKEEGKTHDEFIEQLHLWYGKNRGKSLESEFQILFSL